jgi:hypothetical protein
MAVCIFLWFSSRHNATVTCELLVTGTYSINVNWKCLKQSAQQLTTSGQLWTLDAEGLRVSYGSHVGSCGSTELWLRRAGTLKEMGR